jgi:hypothetical protein
MRTTDARLRYTGVWLLLAIGTSFSTIAYAGQGVWTSGGPHGEDIRALAINPANPAMLYAGTNGGGIFKSTDSGGTWAATNMGLTNLYVSALVIDPENPATLYAGTFYGGIFKSTDSGGTWIAANAGMREPPYVDSLTINPATPPSTPEQPALGPSSPPTPVPLGPPRDCTIRGATTMLSPWP